MSALGRVSPGRRTLKRAVARGCSVLTAMLRVPLSGMAGTGGVSFASCATASVIRRQVARAVVIAVGRELVGARGALLERLLAVALEDQVGGAPDIDLGITSPKL